MKIFAISDLHMTTTENKPMDVFGGAWENYLEQIFLSWNELVSSDDVVLIGGDISWAMQLENAVKDLQIINNQKGRKVLIRGNHDYWWGSISKLRDKLPNDMFALQNDHIRLENTIVCGCRGWSVPIGDSCSEQDKKIYNRELIRMEMALNSGSEQKKDGDTLIALMHFPPFDVLRRDSGFTDLFHKYNVDKVVYGHLHGNNCRADTYIKKGGIEYFLTACDQTQNKLTLIFDSEK